MVFHFWPKLTHPVIAELLVGTWSRGTQNEKGLKTHALDAVPIFVQRRFLCPQPPCVIHEKLATLYKLACMSYSLASVYSELHGGGLAQR